MVTPQERDWTTLLGRIADADQTALAEFYDHTSKVVYGLVLNIVQDRFEAEEITLDAYIQVWRQAGRYNPARGVPSRMAVYARAQPGTRPRSVTAASRSGSRISVGRLCVIDRRNASTRRMCGDGRTDTCRAGGG